MNKSGDVVTTVSIYMVVRGGKGALKMIDFLRVLLDAYKY